MSLWSWLATKVGDTWASSHMLALWPWPAVVVGNPHSRMLWSDYRAFSKLLQPADFIIMRSKPYLGSNAAIPGATKHLAVYLGPVAGEENTETNFIENPSLILGEHEPSMENHERCVIHAISEGVKVQDMGFVLMHADYAVAVRAWRNKAEQSEILLAAMGELDKPYDFNFDQTTDKAIFCTELGLICCSRAGIHPPDPSRIRVKPFGPLVGVALADNFARFPAVCASRSCLDSDFQAQSHMNTVFTGAVMKGWKNRELA